MKKKLLSLTAVAAAMALSACGGGTDSTVTEADSAAEAQKSSETQESSEDESSASSDEEGVEESTEEPEAICDDVIDTDAFHMTFVALDAYSEYSYTVDSSGSAFAPTIEEGYKLLVLEGHIENKATYVIPSNAFSCSITVNDSFEIDDPRFDFCRSNSRELDPYTDFDYAIYANVPEKLIDEFQSASFSIGFNNDMSASVGDGSTENLYTFTSDMKTATLTDENSNGTREGSSSDQAANTKLMNLWSKDFYVDDFNRPADQWYVSTQKFFQGTFNNSIATNANLAVKLVVDSDNVITIFLHSYQDRNPDKNIGFDKTFNITMRTDDGTDHNLTGICYPHPNEFLSRQRFHLHNPHH